MCVSLCSMEVNPNMTISELVEAACCISNNNKNVFGGRLYDIDKHFDGWKRAYVKQRLTEKYCDAANI